MPIDGVVDISAEHVEKFDVFIRAGLLVPVVDVPVVDDSGEPTRGAQRAARGKRRMESEGRMEREGRNG